MTSTSGRPSTPEGRRGSPPPDEPAVLIGAGDARSAQIIGALKVGDVSAMMKLDKRLKKHGSSLLEAVGKEAADRLLHLAARWLQYEACKYLIKDLKLEVDHRGERVIEHKIQDRERGGTPMISAIDALDSANTAQKKKNGEKIVDLLIRRGASTNKARIDGFAPIHAATLRDSLEVVKLLVTHKAEVNAMCESGTVLHIAAESGSSLAVVKHLLDHGADPNVINMSGFTALQVAAMKDSFVVAELLLKNKAEIDAICTKGTALLIASETGASVAIVKLLLDHGADANKSNTRGFRGLHLATLKGSYDVVKLLLSKGADVHAVCEEGTSLHIAAGCGSLKLVTLLLQNEASPDVPDTIGRKAIEVAAINGHRACVESRWNNARCQESNSWLKVYAPVRSCFLSTSCESTPVT